MKESQHRDCDILSPNAAIRRRPGVQQRLEVDQCGLLPLGPQDTMGEEGRAALSPAAKRGGLADVSK